MKRFNSLEIEIISFMVQDVIKTSSVGDFTVYENGAIDSEIDLVGTYQ